MRIISIGGGCMQYPFTPDSNLFFTKEKNVIFSATEHFVHYFYRIQRRLFNKTVQYGNKKNARKYRLVLGWMGKVFNIARHFENMCLEFLLCMKRAQKSWLLPPWKINCTRSFKQNKTLFLFIALVVVVDNGLLFFIGAYKCTININQALFLKRYVFFCIPSLISAKKVWKFLHLEYYLILFLYRE